MADRPPLEIRCSHAAVGPVYDNRHSVAQLQFRGDFAELDGRPDGRDVRSDRNDDPVGLREQRLVQADRNPDAYPG